MRGSKGCEFVASNTDPFIVQLEDGLLVGVPIIGSLIGGFLFVSFAPVPMQFLEKLIIGAIFGGALSLYVTARLFRLLNPGRDRNRKS